MITFKPTFFLLMCFVLIGSGLMAQSSYADANMVAMPSANNDFLKSQPDFNVNTYAGTPEIVVPLYDLGSKVLSIPISLNYNATAGIKVQDVANFPGLGWKLNAGGNISRVVRGLPDEQTNGYIGTNTAGKTVAAGINNTMIGQIGSGTLDGEPDLFTVSTPYFSFEFVLDPNGNPVFANNTGFKFSDNLYMNSNPSTGTFWIITDDNGNQYYFGSSINSREDMTTSLVGTPDQTFTVTWYLDKIVAFNNRDVITLVYWPWFDYSVNHYTSASTSFVSNGNCSAPTVSSNQTITYGYNNPKYINYITSSLGTVMFNYFFDRSDINEGARLSTVVVYPISQITGVQLSTPLKTYQFNYSYFNPTSTDPDLLRLKLDNIKLAGNGSDAPLPYKTFIYNTSVNLPSRKSVEFDYLGYYNTNPTGTALVPTANKAPDLNRATADILTGIKDMSGEIQTFTYELNSAYNATDLPGFPIGNYPVAGLRINRLSKTLPTGETLSTQYVYNDPNGHSTGQVYNGNATNFKRTINLLLYAGGSSACAISGTSTSSESVFNAYDLNGNYCGYSTVKIVAPNGGYEVDQFTNFNDFPDQFNLASTDGTVSGWQTSKQVSAATSLAYKRGLLLNKSIFTASGAEVSSTSNVYTSLDAVTGKAPGVKALAYTYLDGSLTAWVYGQYLNNVENYVLSQTTVTNFDQSDPHLTQQNTSTFTYAANHRLISRVDYADSKGQPRSKSFFYPEDNNIPILSGNEQYAVNKLLNANNTNAVIHTIESRNGSLFQTHNSYLSFRDGSLNQKTLLGSKKTFHGYSSNIEEEQYQYDLDNCNLTSVNKLGAPFLSNLYACNNSYIVAKVRNATNTTYTGVSNSIGTNNNVTLTGWPSIGATSITVDYQGNVTFSQTPLNPNYVGTVTVQLSGSSGHYTGTSYSSGPMTISNVAAGTYTVTYSLISVNSASYANVQMVCTYPKYTGQSYQTAGFFYKGFEDVAGDPTDVPYAGRQYNPGTYRVPFFIQDNRSYQVDYHYLSNGVWHAMTKPYHSNMVLNDGTAIDEVRVYPSDAQMLTYTYDPLVGITSKCDERNRFTFYQYDGFGRLKVVKDSDGNIVNAYDYQYQVLVP